MVPEGPAGALLSIPEREVHWRDDGRGCVIYLRISATQNLETLNQHGLVMMDIREKLLKVTVTDVVQQSTHRFQWLNLYGTVDIERSNYHVSKDKKRLVIWLQKAAGLEAYPWTELLDSRTGTFSKSSEKWPPVLCDLQGAWRSSHEEPIEIIGDLVVWPTGSRDQILLSENPEENELLRLLQLGDGHQVLGEEFYGFFSRQLDTLCWDDGDEWCRVPGLRGKRADAGKEVFSLVYDSALARFRPWMPDVDQAQGRTAANWVPPGRADLAVEVKLIETEPDSGILGIKREILDAVTEDGHSSLLLRDAEALPPQLLLQIRVASLRATEVSGDQLVATLLALRQHSAVRQLSVENEELGLEGLRRWFQWLRPWLAPGLRGVLDLSVKAVQDRCFELKKLTRNKMPEARAFEGFHCGSWCLELKEGNDLLRAATAELLRGLQSRPPNGLSPWKLFGEVRREVAERLFSICERLGSPGSAACGTTERHWIRQYSEAATRALLTKARLQELSETGIAIAEDLLDWGTLTKAHAEFQQQNLDCSSSLHLAMRGLPALATAAAILEQLPARLNDASFRHCHWSAVNSPQLRQSHSDHIEDGCLVAFLFLNPPRWAPEWAGGLRCSGAVADVFGDGGRLVLFKGPGLYELMPSQHSQSVLVLQMHGARNELPASRSAAVSRSTALHLSSAKVSCQQKQDAKQDFLQLTALEISSGQVLCFFESFMPSAFEVD